MPECWHKKLNSEKASRRMNEFRQMENGLAAKKRARRMMKCAVLGKTFVVVISEATVGRLNQQRLSVTSLPHPVPCDYLFASIPITLFTTFSSTLYCSLLALCFFIAEQKFWCCAKSVRLINVPPHTSVPFVICQGKRAASSKKSFKKNTSVGAIRD